MHIGFTYDLKSDYLSQGYSALDVAEFDSSETIDGIISTLYSLGHTVTAIGNLPSLVKRLAQGECWDLVFNIAEGLHGSTRESQIPALLEACSIPVTFADSLTLALCLHKGYCKNIIRDHGIPTSRFLVVSDTEELEAGAAYVNTLTWPLFVKPVGEGTGKGVTPRGKVTTPEQLRTVVQEIVTAFKQPVIIEEFLPGREFTVGITGTGLEARVLGVMEVVLLHTAEPELYTFENKDKYEERVTYRLVDDAEASAAAAIALETYRILGCRDAGRADIRSDKTGAPHFMEINPLAGLNPQHSDLPILCRLLGIPYQTLLRDIVDSAAKRVERGTHA